MSLKLRKGHKDKVQEQEHKSRSKSKKKQEHTVLQCHVRWAPQLSYRIYHVSPRYSNNGTEGAMGDLLDKTEYMYVFPMHMIQADDSTARALRPFTCWITSRTFQVTYASDIYVARTDSNTGKSQIR